MTCPRLLEAASPSRDAAGIRRLLVRSSLSGGLGDCHRRLGARTVICSSPVGVVAGRRPRPSWRTGGGEEMQFYAYRFSAALVGPLSYGPELAGNFRRAATYADRILKGEKPADLRCRRRPSTIS